MSPLIQWQSGVILPWKERRFLSCVKLLLIPQVSTSGSTTTPRCSRVHSTPSQGSYACTQATTHAWLRTLTSTPAPGKPSPSPSTVSAPTNPSLDSGGPLCCFFNLSFYSFLKFLSVISCICFLLHLFLHTNTLTQRYRQLRKQRCQTSKVADCRRASGGGEGQFWELKVYSWCDCFCAMTSQERSGGLILFCHNTSISPSCLKCTSILDLLGY